MAVRKSAVKPVAREWDPEEDYDVTNQKFDIFVNQSIGQIELGDGPVPAMEAALTMVARHAAHDGNEHSEYSFEMPQPNMVDGKALRVEVVYNIEVVS